jgi:hypothetical protein
LRRIALRRGFACRTIAAPLKCNHSQRRLHPVHEPTTTLATDDMTTERKMALSIAADVVVRDEAITVASCVSCRDAAVLDGFAAT